MGEDQGEGQQSRYPSGTLLQRPFNQNEEVDEIFSKQVGEVLWLLVLVLVGDFSSPDVCQKQTETTD